MNRRMNVYKLNFLLLCIFIGMPLFLGLTFLPGKAAAGTAEAYVIRYSSQTGSGFQVKNSSGRSVAVRKDMRLYSGYVLQTAADNYVYLSLDSSKAIKLDQNTKVEIQKEGTKNVVKVHAGKIFFHASEKLKKNESFHVSTSTMSMGIRGTSGYIFADPRYEGGKPAGTVEGMHIYNGLGEVRRNIDSGNKKEISIFLEPGYKVEAETSQAGGDASFSDRPKEIPFEEIPSMVFEEMKKDPVLYKKISEEMPQMKDVSVEDLQKFLEIAKAREEKIQAEKDAYVKKVLEEVQKQYRASLKDDLEDVSVEEKDTDSREDTKNEGEGRPEDQTQTESSNAGSSGTGGSSGSTGGSEGTKDDTGSNPGEDTYPRFGFPVRQPRATLSKEAHSITEMSTLDMALGLSGDGYEPQIFWCDRVGKTLQAPEGIMVDGISNEKISFKITPYCAGHFYFRIKAGEKYSQLCSIKVESGFERENLTSDRMEGTLYLLGIQGDNWVELPDADFTKDHVVWFSESSGSKVRTEKPAGFSVVLTEPDSGTARLTFELNTAEDIEEGTYYFRMKNETACSAVYTLKIALAKEKPLYELDNEREARLQVKGGEIPASIPVKEDIFMECSVFEKGIRGHITESDFTWTMNQADKTVEIMPFPGKTPAEGLHTIYLAVYSETQEESYLALVLEPVTIYYAP